MVVRLIPEIDVHLKDGRKVRMIIDSGAEVSLIPCGLLKGLDYDVIHDNQGVVYTSADGTLLDVKKLIKFCVKSEKGTIIWINKAIVVNNSDGDICSFLLSCKGMLDNCVNLINDDKSIQVWIRGRK